MRDIPQPMRAALSAGVTTLARAWTLTRRDGLRMGFTDHDNPLTIDGVVHEATSGLTTTAMEQATGLGVDSHAVEGALRSDAITDLDVERGLYDRAEVLSWLVDWSNPEVRLLQGRGFIGEIRRGAHAFEAEIAGLTERLNQPMGRVVARGCGARLGDAACGVDLTSPLYLAAGQVAAVAGPLSVTVAGLDGFEAGWFTRGAVSWTGGGSAGTVSTVSDHRRTGGTVLLTLWQAPAVTIAPGDTFTIVAGCDRTAETCRIRFDNLLNYRGFPQMPGDDWAAGYPSTGGSHDGGSLQRG
jgi:uncharacterized phage protein (TIGR02218 family)